jgi:retron-type reverse transcriptase
VCWTWAHLLAEDWLREAYRHPSKARAAGIEGGTAPRDAAPLDDTLRDLHARLRRGRSQAAPVERVWIAQEDGRQRPIGTPPFEETLGQRAGARRLAVLYEQDCSAGSYGFRQGRSPHDALPALRERWSASDKPA